jgi:hypothetical protein
MVETSSSFWCHAVFILLVSRRLHPFGVTPSSSFWCHAVFILLVSRRLHPFGVTPTKEVLAIRSETVKKGKINE